MAKEIFMKFKFLFWIFNVMIFLAIILVLVAPLLMFGQSGAQSYWSKVWWIFALSLLFIITLDAYFIRHWKIFSLIEKQDWPTLLSWLESQIYDKGHLRYTQANLLINTALSVSNLDMLNKLELEIRRKKPRLLRSLGVSLGIPVLLSEDSKAIADYFCPLASSPRNRDHDWAQWCCALVEEKPSPALIGLLHNRNLALRLLSLHLLESKKERLKEDEILLFDEKKGALKNLLKGEKGKELLLRTRGNHLVALVLSQRIMEARNLLLESPT